MWRPLLDDAAEDRSIERAGNCSTFLRDGVEWKGVSMC